MNADGINAHLAALAEFGKDPQGGDPRARAVESHLSDTGTSRTGTGTTLQSAFTLGRALETVLEERSLELGVVSEVKQQTDLVDRRA